VERLDGGSVFRALADERGLSVAEFSKIAENHAAIDVELDKRLAARAQEGDVVLESRLAGWIATNEGLDGLRVWIACDPDERARRVAEREGIPRAAARQANDVREASERQRYEEYYGIDISDLSIYDLVLDSRALAPDDLTAAILERVGS
jgi:cytidylate kinase